MRTTLKLLFALLLASIMFVTGCGDDDTTTTDSSADPADSSTSTTAGGSSTTAGSDLEGTITVSAATSLTDAFTEIADDFTAANPDVEVTFNFESSTTLSTQILEGAPADVYASADEANMALLTAGDLVSHGPEVFTRNELVIVTKPGNPEGISTVADLADAGVISLCGEDVPCGKYAQEVLDNAGVTIPESSVTRGQNVGATLTAVAEGDAVAGIVYVTDAASAGDAVEAISIPADINAIAVYPIGVIETSENSTVAEAFMSYVLGEEGQAILADHGFLPPA